MTRLTPAERRALRARAHHLDPVVMIGEAGLTPAVLLEIERALCAHELVKLRVLGAERAVRARLPLAICSVLATHPVQSIGRIIVLFRPRPPEERPDAAAQPKPRRRRTHRPPR